MSEDQGVWAYAVARAIDGDLLAGFAGVGEQPVRTLAAAGLTAAVTGVSLAEFGEEALRRNLEDLAWLETAAWAHHRVIDAIARSGAVVPLRLATVFRDPDGVSAMLERRRYDLAAALALVEGRTEWGVKVYLAQRQPDESSGTSPGPEGGTPGRAGAAYLLRRKAQLTANEQARRGAAASAGEIHAALRDLAAAALVRPPQAAQLAGQAGQMLLNSAYLVDDERSADWSAAVKELADGHPDVRVELTGPWPPYSFAAIDDQPTAGVAGAVTRDEPSAGEAGETIADGRAAGAPDQPDRAVDQAGPAGRRG